MSYLSKLHTKVLLKMLQEARARGYAGFFPKNPKPEILKAHEHCRDNEKEISESKLCGCFYCLKTFPPANVKEWLDRHGYLAKLIGQEPPKKPRTAFCPKCNIDSVIGDSKVTITQKFLKEMHEYWFEDDPITLDHIKEELAKRPHVPNKQEAARIRQEKAKQKRNR
jgi:hypothetical protein